MKRQISNTAPRRWRTALTRLSLRALILSALFVVCAPTQAQNATGTPAVTVTADGSAVSGGPNEDIHLTAARGSIADTTDGIANFSPAWQWQQGETAGGSFADIASATAATFTPLQEHVGKFLRVCATFDDDAGNRETRCWTSAAAVVNLNDINALPSSVDFPVGRTSRFRLSDFRHEDEEGADYGQVSLFLESLPADGILRISGDTYSSLPIAVFGHEFISSEGVTYAPPADATVGSDYARFDFLAGADGPYGVGPAATITINLVANSAPDFGDATVGTRIWPPGTTTPLVLPAAAGGNNTAYSISPALPDGLAFDADTRTISGTPTTASAIIRYAYAATDVDGETDTLTFAIDPMRPVRLRLRLFLEGPLR